MLFHHRVVSAAATEQSAMNFRMQRFDAPVHDFREPGDVTHIAHGNGGVAQCFGGTASGNQFDAARMQRAREVDQSILVGNAEQRAPDRNQAGIGHRKLPLG